MYIDPLTLIERESNPESSQPGNGIMQELQQQIGIQVDKDELLKALNYDRDQYNKGYEDGKTVGYALALKEYGISKKQKLYADAYDYDRCYYGGAYDDQYCGGCPYKDNCSGYDDEDLE